MAAGTGVVTAIAGCSGNTQSTETSTATPTDQPAYDAPETTTETTETESTVTEETTDAGGATLQMMAQGAIQTLDPISAKGSGAGYDQYGR
ncbi:MAG: ABC transporter substrate-binding protein, partial [Halorhabdus sp.]